MQVRLKDGREVECEFHGSLDDIQCSAAEFVEPCGRNVTDEEINWVLDHYAESIYLEVLECQIGMAESRLDGER